MTNDPGLIILITLLLVAAVIAVGELVREAGYLLRRRRENRVVEHFDPPVEVEVAPCHAFPNGRALVRGRYGDGTYFGEPR